MTVQDTVLSPLIVLSFTKAGIDNAIGTGNFKSIIGSKDISVFDNHSNNFTKMTHSLGAEGKDGGFSLQLELIDPVAEFEQRFMSLNVEDFLTSELYEQGGQVASQAEQKLIDAELSNIPDGGSIAKLEEATKQKKVWITYGIGEDLNDWAGPFQLTLQNAELKIDTSNIKKLILKFMPHADPITANPDIQGGNRKVALHGLKNSAVGTVGPFELGKEVVGSKQFGGDTGPGVGNWFQFADKAGLDIGPLNTFFRNFDVHATLMACLRTMVRKATNCNNVVALMPNINEYGIKSIAHAVIAKRGTGISPEDNESVWLLDAANKCFAKFGASIFIDDVPYWVRSDPKDSTLVETNYAKYLNYFKSCEETQKKYVDKAKYTVQMKSVTEITGGHYEGIKAKLRLIKEALLQNYPTCHIKFVAESRSDITSKFKGANTGVTEDGPIIFFGDAALIQNIVYGNGEKAYKYLHPADKNLRGKGTSPKLTSIPEFRMNVKDPNILKIDIKTDGIYFQALMAGFHTNASSKIGKLNDELSKAGQAGYNADIDAIKSALGAAGTANAGDVIDMLIAAERALTKTDAKTTYIMDSTINNNPAAILAAGYELLYKKAVQVTITTLPHFHLSDHSIIGTEVMINAMAPEAIVPGRGTVTQNLSNAFFSGPYTILGFKHEISSTGIASSQFVLTKKGPK